MSEKFIEKFILFFVYLYNSLPDTFHRLQGLPVSLRAPGWLLKITLDICSVFCELFSAWIYFVSYKYYLT
jgi:hypothetical protein